MPRKHLIAFSAASLMIALLSVLTIMLNLDFRISNWFWQPNHAFHMKGYALEQWFYYSINYAVRWVLIGLIGFALLRVFSGRLKRFDQLAMAVFLVLAIGPGLIVNSLLKDNFGRPRPVQSVEFGGELPSKALFEANWGGKGKSFPSGHAAVPLAFLILSCWLWRREQRDKAVALALLLLGWYGGTSWARVAAGGHHFSDVCWAGYISAVTVLLIDYYLLRRPAKPAPESR